MKTKKVTFTESLLQGETKKFVPTKRKTMQFVQVEIEPEEARHILKYYSNGNRKPSPIVVKKYAHDMKEGNWRNIGDPIRFNSSGQVIDGQHRLYSCIYSDETIPFTFVYGLPESCFEIIDNGKTRTNADILGLAGYEHGAILSAAVRSIIAYENSGNVDAKAGKSFSGANQITKSQILRKLEDCPDIVNYVERYSKSPVVASSITAFCYYILSKLDKAEAEKFLDGVFLGLDLQPDTIEYFLFNKFQRNKNSVHNKLSKTAIIANVFEGWRRYYGLSKNVNFRIAWSPRQKIPNPLE